MAASEQAAWREPQDEDAGFDSASDQALMARFLARPGFLLARVDQICTVLFGESTPGVTLAQAELLLLLDAIGPAPQIALARAAGLDKSTTAFILDNLESAGWIARTADAADRRRSRVEPTPQARARMAEIVARFGELQDRLRASLDRQEAPQLMALLRAIGSNPMSPAPLWVPERDAGPARLVQDAPSFLMRRALQHSYAQFLAATGPLNLTPRQVTLLVILEARPGTTQAGFAKLFGLDPSTCAVIMRNLTSRGLIEHRPAPHDRRARIYSLTEAGREALAQVDPLVDRSDRLLLRGASSGDARMLARQLRRIVLLHSHRLRFPGAILPRQTPDTSQAA